MPPRPERRGGKIEAGQPLDKMVGSRRWWRVRPEPTQGGFDGEVRSEPAPVSRAGDGCFRNPKMVYGGGCGSRGRRVG